MAFDRELARRCLRATGHRQLGIADRSRCGDRAAAQQGDATEGEEADRRHHQVEAQAGQEHRHLGYFQPGFLHHAIGDAAVHADRREAARLRTMDDQQAHHQRIDVVLLGKAQGDRADDGDRGGAQRTERGEHRGDHEHHPRNGHDMAAHRFHCPVHQQVDGAVLLRDGEQIGNADQGQEQIAGKAGQDLLATHVDPQPADDEGQREGDRTHVDRHRGGDDEHDHQTDDRCDLWTHAPSQTRDSRTARMETRHPGVRRRTAWCVIRTARTRYCSRSSALRTHTAAPSRLWNSSTARTSQHG